MIQYISDATDISPAVLKKYFPSDVHEHYERGQIQMTPRDSRFCSSCVVFL